MILIRRQEQPLIVQLNNQNDKLQVQIMEANVNYDLSPFEGNINTREPKGLTFYLQETREIQNASDKIDISVSNDEDIIHHFISLSRKHGWE